MKKFMIAAISAVLLTIALPSNAQKCKFTNKQTDHFTGETIRTKIIRINTRTTLNFYQKDSIYKIKANFVVKGKTEFAITEGSKIFLKLENNILIELKSSEKSSPRFLVGDNQVWSTYETSYYLAKSDLKKLAESGIKYIKLNTYQDQSITLEIKKRKIRKFKEAAICMLSE